MNQKSKNQGLAKNLQSFSIKLAHCNNLKDIIRTLVNVLEFHLQDFYWDVFNVNFEADDKKACFKKFNINRNPTTCLSNLHFNYCNIYKNISCLGNLKSDFEIGINSLHIDGHQLYFFLLPEKETKSKMFLLESAAMSPLMLQTLECYINFAQILALGWKKIHIKEEELIKDDLTGVYNHRYLTTAIENEIKRANRFSEEFSVIFIDLDNFKSVNDVYGHLAGSSVLIQIAEVFKNQLREVDYIFRYGGDEFVIILLGADCNSAAMVSERIRETINKTPLQVGGGQTVNLSTSIGIASYPRHGYDRKSLLHVADKAMYQSKKSGKNKVRIYDGIETPIKSLPSS